MYVSVSALDASTQNVHMLGDSFMRARGWLRPVLLLLLAAPVAHAGITLTTLISFNGTNGANPQNPLVQGSDGNFYGTARWGGVGYNGSAGEGLGAAFKITRNATVAFAVLFYSTNGANPWGGVVEGTDGNYYGTTTFGGTSAQGNIFRMSTNGTITNVAEFHDYDGFYPDAGLVRGTNGYFYGTTSNGGPPNSVGTAFKITSNGVLTSLVSFMGTNGKTPQGPLTQGSDGNFYGTTGIGGTSNLGTVFRMTPAGTLPTLFSFNGSNGSGPNGGVVQGKDGTLYGTTAYGGAFSRGTIFALADSVLRSRARIQESSRQRHGMKPADETHLAKPCDVL